MGTVVEMAGGGGGAEVAGVDPFAVRRFWMVGFWDEDDELRALVVSAAGLDSECARSWLRKTSRTFSG